MCIAESLCRASDTNTHCKSAIVQSHCFKYRTVTGSTLGTGRCCCMKLVSVMLTRTSAYSACMYTGSQGPSGRSWKTAGVAPLVTDLA